MAFGVKVATDHNRPFAGKTQCRGPALATTERAPVVTRAAVCDVDPGTSGVARVAWTDVARFDHEVAAGAVLCGAAPDTLDRLLAATGAAPSGRAPAPPPLGAPRKV